jgi:hypothetical protein
MKMDALLHIKRLVARGQVRFTEKARDEMEVDGLDPQEVIESVLNAQTVEKRLRSLRTCLKSLDRADMGVWNGVLTHPT